MLLIDYIKEHVTTDQIVFEYGYYGIKGAFMKDDDLCISGNKEQVLAFINKEGSLRFLYACSGECNDFEVCKTEDTIYLKYIDFR